jgi:hypothetical protein
MTPLEKAARALAKVQSGTDEWDAYDQAFQETLIEAVRAVLQAIREPSEVMVEAGAVDVYSQTYADHMESEVREDDRRIAQNVWCEMIDAALTE